MTTDDDTIRDAASHHRRAMEHADRAVAFNAGDAARAEASFADALEAERLAAELVDSTGAEPSRSVLFRSAATIAMDAGNRAEAARLATIGLRGRPPPWIADELRDVLSRAQGSELGERMKTMLTLEDLKPGCSLVGLEPPWSHRRGGRADRRGRGPGHLQDARRHAKDRLLGTRRRGRPSASPRSSAPGPSTATGPRSGSSPRPSASTSPTCSTRCWRSTPRSSSRCRTRSPPSTRRCCRASRCASCSPTTRAPARRSWPGLSSRS